MKTAGPSTKFILVITVAMLCTLVLAWWFWVTRAKQVVTSDRVMSDFHRTKPQALESEVRRMLPVGSSRASVDEYLKKRDIEHGVDASGKIVYATARGLQGSTTIATQSLTLTFYFDDALKLKSIDAKVKYTGP
jgi:hypothetical protein